MDTVEIRHRLHEERERLAGLRETLSSAATQPEAELSTADQHPADGASDTFERTKDLAILERTDRQLADVDLATERLDAGTYGLCEVCGQPIGEARLRARPAARRCLHDQEALEEAQAASTRSSTSA